MSVDAILDLANKLTVGAALLVAVIGVLRRWWVPGWLYRDVVRDRDEWKAIAMRSAHLAERAIEAPAPLPEKT